MNTRQRITLSPPGQSPQMHKLEFTGYLASDPRGHELEGKNFVCNFRVLADNSGSQRPVGFNVATWGELGRACQKYLAKGRHVYVSGQLRYNSETGNPRTFTRNDNSSIGCAFELDANMVEFLTSQQTTQKDQQ